MPLRPSAVFLMLPVAALCQTFEVASIKASAPPGSGSRMVGLQGGPGSSDPTRARFVNMDLRGMVCFAYDVSGFQVSGPSWTSEDRFDIIATMEKGTTKEQFRVMLQNLLAERFKLQLHREQKTMSLYSLITAKNGAKLTPTQPDPLADPNPEVRPRAGMQPGGMQKDKDGYPKFPPGVTMMGMYDNHGQNRAALQAHKETLAWLVKMVSGQLGAPVVDDTGLTDKYDYSMTWVPEAPGAIPAENQDLGGPTLMSALQDQLGLKLISKKAPVETIVIDSAERTPTEN